MSTYDNWKLRSDRDDNPSEEDLPIDPADYIEYEDRQEVLRSMGRSEDLPDETEELRAFHEDYDCFGNE